jgi:hypothetical protein
MCVSGRLIFLKAPLQPCHRRRNFGAALAAETLHFDSSPGAGWTAPGPFLGLSVAKHHLLARVGRRWGAML